MTSHKLPRTLQDAYRELIRSGAIEENDAQSALVERLARLANELREQTTKRSPLLGMLRRKEPPPRGVYLWGGVGRGKSMLMDLFFEHAPVERKRRAHFHSFMLDVHARIHRTRKEHANGTKGRNPVPHVARELAAEASLLCLDELQVHDVADAMILGRLFTALLKESVTIVITSNRRPDDLYQGGLQRDRFMKFVALVLEQLDVIELQSREDFRLKQLQAMQKVFVTPLGAKADQFLDHAFRTLTHHAEGTPQRLEMQGRTLTIEARGGVARASFAELCARPLGAADYLAIAGEFHTLILSGIPKLSPEKRNEAKRFVTLVDALYEHHVNLIASADAAPNELYPAGDGSFEFSRTASRLIEMQSESYLAEAHEDAASQS